MKYLVTSFFDDKGNVRAKYAPIDEKDVPGVVPYESTERYDIYRDVCDTAAEARALVAEARIA